MKTVRATEAKAHLSRLLDDAARGERVAITRNGVTVALLIPAPADREDDPREIVRQLRELRRGITLGGLSLREMIAEGRRG